jgi:rhodanese-related sulfurtransferase
MAKKNKASSKKQGSANQWKNRQWWLAGIGFIIVIVVGLVLILNPSPVSTSTVASLPAEIPVDTAYEKYEQGKFVLDVRTPQEWDEYHIPNTTLIPLDELEFRVNEVPDDQEVVVICRSGNRSQVGRDILLNADHPSVTSVSGGIKEWAVNGYPIEGVIP